MGYNNDASLIGGHGNRPSNNVNFYFGTVMGISTSGDKMVKVRIKGLDDKIDDENLPWCAPFLPIMYSSLPKVGEMVKIIPQSTDDVYLNREWMGPIVTNDLNVDYQSNTTALSNQGLSTYKENIDTQSMTDHEYLYPQDSTMFQGRNNSDIVLGDNQVDIRTGKHEPKDKTKKNMKNPSNLKLGVVQGNSYTLNHADKILLMSHGQFKAVVDEEELKLMIDEAMSATYAEPMMEFINMVQDFVANHIHASNLPPNKGTGSVRDILNFDVNSIRANNIKIK